MQCFFADLIIDSMDVSGDQHIDVDTNLFKHRLNNDGQPISEIPIEGSECDNVTHLQHFYDYRFLDQSCMPRCYYVSIDYQRSFFTMQLLVLVMAFWLSAL